MKNRTGIAFLLLPLILAAILLCGCAQSRVAQDGDNAPSAGKVQPDAEGSTRYDIPALKGSISVPGGYYVFAKNIPFTDEMCQDIGVDPDGMRQYLSLVSTQAMIVPSGEPYKSSPTIYVKVKGKEFEDVTLASLSQKDYTMLASACVMGFGVSDYKTVEGNGLRYIVFSHNIGLGNTCRYATILSGHMVYVYMETGDKPITKEQQADLEYIALSIQYGL